MCDEHATCGTSPSTRIVGLWDTTVARRLGELILWLEELAQMCVASGLSGVDVIVIGGQAIERIPSQGMSSEELRARSSGVPLVDLLAAFAVVRHIHAVADVEAAEKVIADSTECVVWPAPLELLRHNFDTTLRIQAAWRRGMAIVPLTIATPYAAWARTALIDMGKRPWIAVHLKNNPKALDQSNADSAVWYDFFRQSATFGGTFVLVGDDAVTTEILRIPNIQCSAKWPGSSLAGHLAIIQKTDAFMGMMSGFCNLTIFGGTPYAIFKNPGHHEAQMSVELGAGDSYPFAHEGQRVLRMRETPQLLNEELHRLLAVISYRKGPNA